MQEASNLDATKKSRQGMSPETTPGRSVLSSSLSSLSSSSSSSVSLYSGEMAKKRAKQAQKVANGTRPGLALPMNRAGLGRRNGEPWKLETGDPPRKTAFDVARRGGLLTKVGTQVEKVEGERSMGNGRSGGKRKLCQLSQ